MGSKKRKKEAEAAAAPAQETRHYGPCIVAALVWFVTVFYALVVVRSLFDVTLYRNMPAKLLLHMTWNERFFTQFETLHGTFWLALLGMGGCALAYARRSTRLAHAMIVIGILAVAFLMTGTLARVQ